jgi:hypothetical protein
MDLGRPFVLLAWLFTAIQVVFLGLALLGPVARSGAAMPAWWLVLAAGALALAGFLSVGTRARGAAGPRPVLGALALAALAAAAAAAAVAVIAGAGAAATVLALGQTAWSVILLVLVTGLVATERGRPALSDRDV